MSFSSSLSAAEQQNLIATANAAVARFVDLFNSKSGCRNFFTREDIEDIAGTAILKVWRSIDSFDPERAKLSTWVNRIAVNCAKDALDYKMKRLSISESMYVKGKDDDDEYGADEFILDPDVLSKMSENSADGRVLRGELRDRICAEVSKMSDKRRRVAHMHNVGFTPKEMAAIEGCTPTAASKCIWDIREALRTALAEWSGEARPSAC
jgi:RNA polymerase sigma-70 factor (ECF subfamily)